ncbi:zinc ABC transporter substrate-binding protein, partial [Georgenia sp. 10Sc9-8]|nr:zinc ABC transporter substrate-binding protein [Georgenia halotolerans]
AHEHAEEAHEHAEDGHDDAEDGHDDDGHAHDDDIDPHFWLDPTRLAQVADAVAEQLAEVDSAGAADYAANAERLTEDLAALDAELEAGLASCDSRTIVVSHAAYGYLAEAYDLDQRSISGVDPDTEPSPARLAEIGAVVAEEDVSTIFTESAVGAQVAETLAGDLGVRTAVLDPLEIQADEDADYQQVMRANLEALQEALGCR